MKLQFVGSGGHSLVLRDICLEFGIEIVETSGLKVLRNGALTPEKLEARYNEGINCEDSFPCLIASSVSCSNLCKIGQGTQILPGAVINAGAEIGDFCIINSGAIIEHGAKIGNGCHIAPGAVVLADVRIGDFSFIGAGAVVIQGSVVPPRSFIKAGSVCNNKPS